MPTAALLCLLSVLPSPVLWIKPDGSIQSPVTVRFSPGVGVVASPYGKAFDFSGPSSALTMTDDPRLLPKGSFTVGTWLYLRSHVGNGHSHPSSQVFFYGDDRSGLDPIFMTVLSDGKIAFGVVSDKNEVLYTSSPIRLNQWTHVVGQYDREQRAVRLWLDGRLAGSISDGVVPMRKLDRSNSPGFGIGNVQNPEWGIHRMPLNGMLADFRLYHHLVSPAECGYVDNLSHPNRE